MKAQAPLPPIPDDPGICRWCGVRAIETLSYGVLGRFCPSGCSANPIATRVCEDCGREFLTGAPLAHQCYECAQKEHRAHVADNAPAIRGYLRDRIRIGANRHTLTDIDDPLTEDERETRRLKG